MESKFCNGCKEDKPITCFYRSEDHKGKTSYFCKECDNLLNLKNKHKRGARIPLGENKNCGPYLGVFIAEKALSTFFKHIERMPYGNPGYDFKCDKGYKIDVKSACLETFLNRSSSWHINIRKNIESDYFLCLLFNSRKDLKPLYVLLIPGKLVNNKTGIGITNTSKGLSKWIKYMQPLDKVINCCNLIREKQLGELK